MLLHIIIFIKYFITYNILLQKFGKIIVIGEKIYLLYIFIYLLIDICFDSHQINQIIIHAILVISNYIVIIISKQ